MKKINKIRYLLESKQLFKASQQFQKTQIIQNSNFIKRNLVCRIQCADTTPSKLESLMAYLHVTM